MVLLILEFQYFNIFKQMYHYFCRPKHEEKKKTINVDQIQ